MPPDPTHWTFKAWSHYNIYFYWSLINRQTQNFVPGCPTISNQLWHRLAWPQEVPLAVLLRTAVWLLARAKCEVDLMNGSRDMQRAVIHTYTDRQRCLPLWLDDTATAPSIGQMAPNLPRSLRRHIYTCPPNAVAIAQTIQEIWHFFVT